MSSDDAALGAADTQFDESRAVAVAAPPPVHAGKLRSGDVLGRYEVVELRGMGAMGEVYRARDRALGREVALKLVHRARESSCGVMCALLAREAQTMARLQHANLATVHDVGEHDGCVYLAMEYIDGVTLREWAPGRSWPERLDAVLDVGRALAAAHAAQVVHRDVKPDNVLVDKSGRVIVTDFGVARNLTELDAASSVECGCTSGVQLPDLDSAAVGTPQYMAPEQFEGRPADGRSDQFGFAVLVWEVLYGAPPFPGENAAAIYASILEQRFVPVSNSDIPSAIAETLRRALRVAPSARFVSMTDMVERLTAAVA